MKIKIFHGLTFLLCFNTFLPLLTARDLTIKGKIRDANTHRELAEVNIYVESLNIGTTSDGRGNFSLKLPEKLAEAKLIIEHVGYFPYSLTVREAVFKNVFDLFPRILVFPLLKIEAQKNRPAIMKDLPLSVSILESREFEIRGFVDAGDLLKMEQSIQVKEEFSGKKTLALRGGNPNDVVVLFNGIRLNNIFDNIFDLSLINLEDIKYFNIIKGGNSTLYGPEAISGAINIVPKSHRNYKVRLQQKLGTYSSGDWTAQLNSRVNDRMNLSYSYKQGTTTRIYEDSLANNETYVNENHYHTASLVYDFPSPNNNFQKQLSLMYVQADLNYKNNRLDESLKNLNRLFSIRYQGNIFFLRKTDLNVSYRNLDNWHKSDFKTNHFEKTIFNDVYYVHFENSFEFSEIEVLLAYQFEKGELDYRDQRSAFPEYLPGVQSAVMTQKKHGAVSIFKWHIPTDSDFYKKTDIDISFRRDYVANHFENMDYANQNPGSGSFPFTPLEAKNWRESLLKFSSYLKGGNETLQINGYMTYGGNYKIPTMFQQISIPEAFGDTPSLTRPNLKPEENNSTELGLELLGELPESLNLTGWQFKANYFRNSYNNKLRTYYLPGIPVAFYDNVKNAEISGFESKAGIFLYRKKLTLEAGSSLYSISETAAFPFKADKKFTVSLGLEHAGFSFLLFWFKESSQTGWIRDLEGRLIEVELAGYSNIDVHLDKKFELFRTKFFANFSGRNLKDDDTKFNGIAIRDRRFYVTVGFQY